jgi:nucleotide-binding universal stress UspA family protein
MVVEGPAGQDILDAAEDAELIVVGARGHSELTQLIIGSVSQHVLHHARVPVVVIPHAAA